MMSLPSAVPPAGARAEPIVSAASARVNAGRDGLLRFRLDTLAASVCNDADVQVRNRGTVGGNVCSNDPTNHFPPLMVALGATMTIAASAGERTVSAEEFFLGVYMTAVGPGELLTKISIPPAQGARRLRRRHDRQGRDRASSTRRDA